ncbi:hypothetical protein F7R91_25675 [Streptomyces luteolifulvus]|uniref:Uncharacterized protein n=1 Tax=Streptomyces luteolifulvus TaxID=2615112 RepID=A0A6H9UWP7_9ACTN|nr:hypothetical protein F7R91_25675 [Streptomyces luteolifulvus]
MVLVDEEAAIRRQSASALVGCLDAQCRTWVAAWAVLCAAGLAATAELNASSGPDPQPQETVSAECAECIADIEMGAALLK